MKKLYLFISILTIQYANAQTVFWTENFITSTCGQGTLAAGYVTPNGTWNVTPTGVNDAESNNFYISATENGNGAGNCGSACGTNRTLHVGSNDGFVPTDGGASYDAGGVCPTFFCVTANWRAESPVVNCTNYHIINLTFNYIEFGQGTIDDATLWYYDGITWAQLDPLAKTPCCGGICNGNRQGQWTAFTIALPSSADYNPNVKVGFNWTNDDTDGAGTDPSFAVDDITLAGNLLSSVSELKHVSFSIYPNPAKDIITVSATSITEGLHYNICDIAGRHLLNSAMTQPQENIDISVLNSGCYFMQLADKQNKVITTSRFIKQ